VLNTQGVEPGLPPSCGCPHHLTSTSTSACRSVATASGWLGAQYFASRIGKRVEGTLWGYSNSWMPASGTTAWLSGGSPSCRRPPDGPATCPTRSWPYEGPRTLKGAVPALFLILSFTQLVQHPQPTAPHAPSQNQKQRCGPSHSALRPAAWACCCLPAVSFPCDCITPIARAAPVACARDGPCLARLVPRCASYPLLRITGGRH